MQQPWRITSVFYATVFTALICLLSTHLKAQNRLLDSMQKAFTYKPKAVATFHNRNTFALAERIKLYGLKVGLDFNNSTQIYAGIYGSFESDPELKANSNASLPYDSLAESHQTAYFSLGMEQTFFKKGKLSLSIPAQVGFGSYTSTLYFAEDSLKEIVRSSKLMMPLEIGINGYYAFYDWLGLKSGFGLRLIAGSKDVFVQSSPYYNLGLAIKLGVIYRKIRD